MHAQVALGEIEDPPAFTDVAAGQLHFLFEELARGLGVSRIKQPMNSADHVRPLTCFKLRGCGFFEYARSMRIGRCLGVVVGLVWLSGCPDESGDKDAGSAPDT